MNFLSSSSLAQDILYFCTSNIWTAILGVRFYIFHSSVYMFIFHSWLYVLITLTANNAGCFGTNFKNIFQSFFFTYIHIAILSTNSASFFNYYLLYVWWTMSCTTSKRAVRAMPYSRGQNITFQLPSWATVCQSIVNVQFVFWCVIAFLLQAVANRITGNGT